MQPWALERYKANREGMKPADRGKETADPIMYPYCLPQGMPRVYTVPFSFEIVQKSERVYMLFEANHQIRRIYTDGKKHLEGWVASFMGTSTGRWDGDTLVVETDNILGLDGGAWIDTFGHPQSDALRVTERIRRVNHDTLQIDLLFDDPKTYTKPWAGRKVFRLKPDWDLTEQILCENHQREEFVQDMAHGKPKGRP